MKKLIFKIKIIIFIIKFINENRKRPWYERGLVYSVAGLALIYLISTLHAFYIGNYEFNDVPKVLISIAAFLLTQRFHHADHFHKKYDYLDTFYLKILEHAVVRPKLRDNKFTSTYKKNDEIAESERYSYEAYAYICWNFAESIFDKGIYPELDEKLMMTWFCVIETENNQHRVWFEDEDNWGKFKPEFRYYILANEKLEPFNEKNKELEGLKKLGEINKTWKNKMAKIEQAKGIINELVLSNDINSQSNQGSN